MENLTPEDVAQLLSAGAILLIDVREPAEFEAGHIAGARLVPLSSFDPAELPDAGGRQIVFQCGSGMRSAKAMAAAAAAGVAVRGHLAGGLQAWAAAGLPVARD